MENKTASRKQEDFGLLSPYYNFSFACMNPKKQLRHFYIKDFEPIRKEEHFDCLTTLDRSYNPYIINPVYQLFIMLQQNSIRILDWFDSNKKMDDEKFSEIKEVYYFLFQNNNFWKSFEQNIERYTSIEGFLYGELWENLRVRCRSFLKRAALPIWQKFEKPIQFDYFLYPVNFEMYQLLPYWSEFETYEQKTWEELKSKYDLLYKDAVLNFDRDC